MIIKDKLLIGLFALALPLNAGAVTFASADSTQQEVKKANGKADKEKQEDKAADKKKEKDEYAELIKKSVSLERGLFDVHHIEDKWYFDVPDSLLGRYILAVTRLTGVPQGVGKFSGEEVLSAGLRDVAGGRFQDQNRADAAGFDRRPHHRGVQDHRQEPPTGHESHRGVVLLDARQQLDGHALLRFQAV